MTISAREKNCSDALRACLSFFSPIAAPRMMTVLPMDNPMIIGNHVLHVWAPVATARHGCRCGVAAHNETGFGRPVQCLHKTIVARNGAANRSSSVLTRTFRQIQTVDYPYVKFSRLRKTPTQAAGHFKPISNSSGASFLVFTVIAWPIQV
jgi:hypothetical protein